MLGCRCNWPICMYVPLLSPAHGTKHATFTLCFCLQWLFKTCVHCWAIVPQITSPILFWDQPIKTAKKLNGQLIPLSPPLFTFMASRGRTQATLDTSEAGLASSPPRQGGWAKKLTEKASAAGVHSTPQSRLANIPSTHDKDVEEIDINGELAKQDAESGTDSVNNDIPRAQLGHPCNNLRPAQVTVYDPFVDPSQTQSTKTSSTNDVQYFFEQTTENSICKNCRYISLI